MQTLVFATDKEDVNSTLWKREFNTTENILLTSSAIWLTEL
ncbi:MAG: hypothetical protein WCF03_18225 [Nitrososphaeraceae archaeon]